MNETTMPTVGPPPPKHRPDHIRTYKSVKGKDLTAHIFFPKGFNGAPRVNPWSPLHDPPSPKATAWSSASGEGRHHAEANDNSIPPRINAGSPAKADESESIPGYVFFHPGGWTMGEPEWGYDICRHLSRLGVVAISFEYRLSSIGGYSPAEAVSDAKSAIRWTRERSVELGIDPNMVLAGGISAGGHLAACTAMVPGFDDPDDNMNYSNVPQAVALHTPPVNPATDDHFKDLLQEGTKPEDLSPFHHVKTGLPPMVIIQGTADEIVSYDSVKEFSRKMQEAGNQCKLHTFEGADHFSIHATDQARAIRLIDEFVISVIRRH